MIWSGDAGGQTCEACVVEGVNSSQDLFDTRAETTYASDAVILLTELRLDGKGNKNERTRKAFFAWGMASHGAGRSRKTGKG